MRFFGSPIFNGPVALSSGSGTITVDLETGRASKANTIAIIVTRADQAGHLVWDAADTKGLPFPVVEEGAEAFVVGAFHTGASFPTHFKTTAGVLEVLVLEVVA